MSIDPPYSQDFLFSRITDVHFGGGDWVAIYLFPAIHESVFTSTTVSASFPHLVGGTPGVPCLTNNNGPGDFHTAIALDYVLVASDITHEVTTDSGKKFNSFGVKVRENAPLGGTPADQVLCFIRIDQALKQAGVPFVMRVITTIIDANNSSQPLSVGTFRDKSITAGYEVNSTDAFRMTLPGVVGKALAAMNPLSPHQDFQIDPTSLSVTWL